MKLVYDAFPATQEANYKTISENHHDFGVVDAKGRSVGMLVTATEFDCVPAVEGRYCRTVFPLGHMHCFCAISTRNNKPFGSATIYVHDQDKGVALEEINARIERARKVAVRKFIAI